MIVFGYNDPILKRLQSFGLYNQMESKKIVHRPMNNPAAPSSGISASLRQATVYQTENFKRPKGRGIKPPSAGD